MKLLEQRISIECVKLIERHAPFYNICTHVQTVLRGLDMCRNICFDLTYFPLLLLLFFVRHFLRSHVCVHMLVLMRAAVIEAVLQHKVWCVQPESCHKQSAATSVKQQAWENWVLCRLHPTLHSLNRPTHLANAVISE